MSFPVRILFWEAVCFLSPLAFANYFFFFLVFLRDLGISALTLSSSFAMKVRKTSIFLWRQLVSIFSDSGLIPERVSWGSCERRSLTLTVQPWNIKNSASILQWFLEVLHWGSRHSSYWFFELLIYYSGMSSCSANVECLLLDIQNKILKLFRVDQIFDTFWRSWPLIVQISI